MGRIINLCHLTDDSRCRHRASAVDFMLALFIDRAEAVIRMTDKLIGFDREEHQGLKVRREHIDDMRTKHNGLRLRKCHEAAKSTVIELKAFGREIGFFIRKYLTRALYKDLEQLIESIVAGFENTRDNILGRLIETLGQALLLDLIPGIVDVTIESHTLIIMLSQALCFTFA